MLPISVKSVPGCLVLIVPRLIGVPVALTPGFGPHDDVAVLAAALLLLVPAAELDELDVAAPPLAELLELLELLEPHPASATRASAASNAKPTRIRDTTSKILIDVSSPRVHTTSRDPLEVCAY
jgi:hypothetical protein